MPVRVAGAQLNLTVGDIGGNESKIAGAIAQAEEGGADILLLPELAITGYPPEDLVKRPDFVDDNIAALGRLAALTESVVAIVGFVDRSSRSSSGGSDSETRDVANAAGVLAKGHVRGIYHKVLLPNFGVFDEDRYFTVGETPGMTWDIAGHPVGISICEDIWSAVGPPTVQAANGAQILLNINASPFHRGKAADREAMLAERAREARAPVVYLNLVGGQDELVFDGASVVIDAGGTVIHRSPQFEEDFFLVEVPTGPEPGNKQKVTPHLDPTEEVYRALTTGLGDYVTKNGFDRVVVLSLIHI